MPSRSLSLSTNAVLAVAVAKKEPPFLLCVPASVDVEHAWRATLDDELMRFIFGELVGGTTEINQDDVMAKITDRVSQDHRLHRRSIVVGVVHREDADLHDTTPARRVARGFSVRSWIARGRGFNGGASVVPHSSDEEDQTLVPFAPHGTIARARSLVIATPTSVMAPKTTLQPIPISLWCSAAIATPAEVTRAAMT